MPVGVRPLAIATSPAVTTPGVVVVMGVATITGLTAGQFITAVQQTSGPSGSGDPGCLAPSPASYNFASVTATSATIALPFGTWKLYTGASAGATTSPVSNSRMTVIATPLSTGGASSSNGGVLVMDPRHP
jgi:hypothetical protein